MKNKKKDNKDTKKMKEYLKDMKKTIEIKTNINAYSIIVNLIDTIGIKSLIRLIFHYCFFKGYPKLTTMLKIFATNEDVKIVEGMVVFKYLIDEWDKVLKNATNHWKNKVVKIFKKGKK